MLAMANREILSYLVLSLFGGLRPYEFVTEDRDGVWHHLEWKAIGKDIVKGATLGKTQLARRVPVGTTLQQWIEFIRKKEAGNIQGRVVGGFAFYQRLRKWKRAFLPENIVVEHDVLRHCYGTYRAVLLGEVGKVGWLVKFEPVDVEIFAARIGGKRAASLETRCVESALEDLKAITQRLQSILGAE